MMYEYIYIYMIICENEIRLHTSSLREGASTGACVCATIW